MTDRELLEMAAKAAGVNGRWLELDAEFKLDSPVIADGTKRYFWRPLQDDGDAMRLAVDLSFQVKPCETGVDVCDEYGDDVWSEFTEPNSCHYQMARKAIVSAAAEIGKSMEKSQ